ncbi:VPLPA-CTERM sorting domain-containing protein [Pacificoceanicola onchidii]|uniref:VPLPA-CTERM sorting domain-containing protein n=1 Tax=Pacificoceanicola onchidii TaxID=2562685 RepID=UPI001F105D10|nr:VPLPA-CTERM sorting domain-containing protein [Pacificoceanicola onchidii]
MDAILTSQINNEADAQTSNTAEEDAQRTFLEWLALVLFGIGAEDLDTSRSSGGDLLARFTVDPEEFPQLEGLVELAGERLDLVVAKEDDPQKTITSGFSLSACTEKNKGELCGFTVIGLSETSNALAALMSGEFEAGDIQILPTTEAIALGAGLDGNAVAIAPVPLPASGLLFLAALGGLGALRRRR